MPRLKKSPDFIDPSGIDSFKYWYEAAFVDIYDGDTVWLHTRNGFHSAMESIKFRLARINAPEYKNKKRIIQPDGEVSRDYLLSLIEGKPLIIQSIKTRKGWDKQGMFGRYLVEIYVDGVNINNKMVADGYADWYDK